METPSIQWDVRSTDIGEWFIKATTLIGLEIFPITTAHLPETEIEINLRKTLKHEKT